MILDTCHGNSTAVGTIDLGLTIADFSASLAHGEYCAKNASYIRPDDAGSILPWPYTLAWFLIHFPITLIRVHRWEKVQALSIILAVTTVWFQLQAYTSSIEPEAVLVWMPIFVVLDIGAMMQLVFLIVEDTGFWPLVRALPNFLPLSARRSSTASSTVVGSEEVRIEGSGKTATATPLPPSWNELSREPASSELVGRAWLAMLSFILGILLLSIQLFGLSMAIKGFQSDHVTAQWCSTFFATAVAVESDCRLYNVTPSLSQGIGCITIKGYEQYTWLQASIIIISLSLAFQVFDCTIMTLVSSTTRWRGAKMKRPWFTMFTGNIVLLVLIVVGVFQSQRLPRDVSPSVLVYKHGMGLGDSNHTCIGELTPYGVRGAIIGWTDGFLESWGDTYSPKSYSPKSY
ncbi:hypothetical protein BHE90_003026 [Fusarium euwallaceae]|uniref:Uncharacterized protein n=4 Tax=Fusarium solani species complex TaxID=232080 RepID=A0A3M2S851_9HYPO|nr:hypothetical protein CDV36_007034 [Fusarium kuroshium]RSL88658.1 hypothetical protein CEP51_001594 [Fusarium floridanum]RSM02348.1 hypothetical protein CEP52_008047 [Fusarium oligoseptatum]RTE82447.1 hypothetical protein BHE90_003026 [Fusarium euwallaceae]